MTAPSGKAPSRKVQKGGHSANNFFSDLDMVMLSHELGNSLNGLLGMTGILRDSGLNAEQDRWVTTIEQSGRQMHALIAFAGAVHNGQSHSPGQRRLDGLELLEQVVISHFPAARARKNRLLLVADPDLPRYWFSERCPLRQLLDNLVDNAIKFTESGDIVLHAGKPSANSAPGALKLKVSDTGSGIADSVGERIFDAYDRGACTSEDAPPGSGLGLFICRRIVTGMNGSIDFVPGGLGGTCFEVILPGLLDKEEVTLPLSSLLTRFHCLLRLEAPLYQAVENILARLGVGSSEYEPGGAGCSPYRYPLLVREAQMSDGAPGPNLLLEPQSPEFTTGTRLLSAPILESSMGLKLLELALEWCAFRAPDGTQGSVPRLR